jgi:hypothetical protein
LYTRGMHAATVKKTIIKLACSLKIQLPRNMPTEEYAMPKKNISQGFFTALKGFVKDSKTIKYNG